MSRAHRSGPAYGDAKNPDMEMVTAGPVSVEDDEIVKRTKEAARQLATTPQLAILYLPHGADSQSLVEKLHAELKVPVIGGTTGGAAFTEHGITLTGGVAAVLGGDQLRTSISVVEHLRERGHSAVQPALERLEVGSARHAAVYCMADAFACDGEAIVRQFSELRKPHVRFFGGTAGDCWKFSGATEVFAGDRVVSNAAVFAAIFPEAAPDVQVRHGFTPGEQTRELLVTKIEGNRLISLNQLPAAEVYRDELRRLGYWDGHQDFLHTAALYELGAVTPFGEGLKIRVAMAVHPDHSITLGGSLRKGESLRVVRSTPESLIHAAKEVSERVTQNLKRPPKGKLVFDCAARWKLLGGRYRDQVDAFCQDGTPTLGVACYGEIAKSGTTIEGFHNTTAVMAAW